MINNDNFANSIEIFGPFETLTGNNVGYTAEAGEPTQSGFVNSAWWSWTASSNVAVVISNFGSNFDTSLSIFTGTSVDALTRIAQSTTGTFNPVGSKLSFLANAGETYHFAVDGTHSSTGDIQINFAERGPITFGSAGRDNPLNGTSGDDYIAGLGGNDVIRGFAGNDVIDGGAGNDNIFGIAGEDTLFGGEGIDFLNYSDSFEAIFVTLSSSFNSFGGTAQRDLNIGFENLVGSNFDDILIGDEGNNVLRGGAGDDTLDGKAGNDTVFGEAGADAMAGGSGIDFLNYIESNAAVNVTLSSGVGSGGDAEGDTNVGFERMIGSNFNDILTGDSVGNILQGRIGSDVMSGGGGRDILIGGMGVDFLTGGAGLDAFRFLSVPRINDVIDDFSGDVIQVKGRNFGGGLSNGLLDESAFVLGSAATTADHRFIYDGRLLFFDVDGTGGASQVLLASISNIAAGADAVVNANNIQVI